MSRLDRLERKIARRRRRRDRAQAGRKRQLRLYDRNGKRGHRKAAGRWGRAAVRHDKAIEKLQRLIKKARARRPKSGTGAWGGSKSIIVNETRPVAEAYGAPRSSSKRGVKHWATLLNPGSDHSVLAVTAFADDYATTNGASLAHAIADALGINGYSTGNYNGYYIWRNGRRYRVQILWAVSGHWDHVHIGIRRA